MCSLAAVVARLSVQVMTLSHATTLSGSGLYRLKTCKVCILRLLATPNAVSFPLQEQTLLLLTLAALK